MQKLTNKHGLPRPLFRAIDNSAYVPQGDISVTRLIDSPRIRILSKYNETEADAIDQIWSLLGSSVHHIIDRCTNNNEVQEVMVQVKLLQELMKNVTNKYYKGVWKQAYTNPVMKEVYLLFTEYQKKIKELETYGKDFIAEERMLLEVGSVKKLLSGTYDLFDLIDESLNDYKVTSAWKYLSYHKWVKKNTDAHFDYIKDNPYFFGEGFEWRMQLNIYRVMIKKLYGRETKAMNIITILRDWSKSEAQRDKGKNSYPQEQVQTISIPIIPDTVVWEYINGMVDYHFKIEEAYKVKGESVLPICTPKQRWKMEDKIAFMRPNNVRATSVFSIKDNSDLEKVYSEFEKKQKEYPDIYIQERPGKDIRCEDYCNVKNLCSYYKEKYAPKTDKDGFTEVK